MKVIGYIVFLVGLWLMVSPQATLGLQELRWMANYAFPGEVLLGAVVSAAALLLIVKPEQNRVEE